MRKLIAAGFLSVSFFALAENEMYTNACGNYFADSSDKKILEECLGEVAQGNAHSQAFLGYMHLIGAGVELDYYKAIELFELSAEQGNSLALNNLANMYERGVIVDEDREKAIKLYQKSCTNGDKGACMSANRLLENN